MNKVEIKVTNQFESFDRLYQAFINKEVIDEVHLHFSKWDFLCPHTIVTLAQLLIRLKNNNENISILPFYDIQSDKIPQEGHKTAKEFLNDIGFSKFIDNNYKVGTVVDFKTDLLAMPLCRIGEESRVSYANTFHSFLMLKDETKDWFGFIKSVNEICDNVYDHAYGKPKEIDYLSKHLGCFTYTAYWEKSQAGWKYRVVVSDLGIGIIKKIREEKKLYDLSDETVINMAFSEGFTTNCQINNYGSGLFNLKSIVMSDKGRLTIYLKEGGFELNNNTGVIEKTDDKIPPNFCGTLIYLALSCDSFPKEEDVNNYYD